MRPRSRSTSLHRRPHTSPRLMPVIAAPGTTGRGVHPPSGRGTPWSARGSTRPPRALGRLDGGWLRRDGHVAPGPLRCTLWSVSPNMGAVGRRGGYYDLDGSVCLLRAFRPSAPQYRRCGPMITAAFLLWSWRAGPLRSVVSGQSSPLTNANGTRAGLCLTASASASSGSPPSR